MERDEILKRSRNENKGKYDERELLAFGSSAKIGMMVGGILCAILILLAEVVFNNHEIGLTAWLVYSAMRCSNHITLFVKLRGKRQLVYSIIYGLLTIAFIVALCITLAR